MSEHDLPEQVLAAARADLRAFRPERTPPFATLTTRKRKRDLRRGTGVLAAIALAVAGVALVPAALNGQDRLPQQLAGPSGPATCQSLLQDKRLASSRMVEASSYGSGRTLCLYADPAAKTAAATPQNPVPGLKAVLDKDGSYTVEPTTFTSSPVDPGDAGPVGPDADPSRENLSACRIPGEAANTASPLVGLTEDQARQRAAQQAKTTRVICRDGVAQPVTADLREDRNDLFVRNGVVTGTLS